MAAPTTLVAHWTAELARLTDAAAEVAAELPAATGAATAADGALAAAAAAADAAREAVASIRRQLAEVPTPADAPPLIAALNAARIALQRATAAQISAATEAAGQRAEVAFWSERRQAVAGATATAGAALAVANEQAAQRQQLTAEVALPPWSDLPAAATAALAAEGAAALANVVADLPADADPARSLLAHLRGRRTAAGAALARAAAMADDARAQQDGWIEKTNRKGDKTARLGREFADQLARLRDWHDGAPGRFDRAVASLQALAARPVSPLSAEQRAALFTADAALATARGDALALATQRDATRSAWRQAADDYASAFLAAHHKDPDKSEADLLAADAALQAKHDEEATRRAARDAAAAALLPQAGLLEDWLAAVPEALWRDFEALDDATAVLEAIRTTVPAALVTAMTNAEKALAQNLDAAAREARAAQALADALRLREAALAAERDDNPRRRLAALRSIG